MKQFKSESKRLLEMMINSIYTHKEIFLRELISNSSDAIDKLYYKSLSDENISFNRDDFYIMIELDKDNRTITLTDTGIGMSKDELEENLGTIAKSGSFAFKNENKTDDVDIIGQFGVGFYSAFMVADTVSVKSRAFGSDVAYEWVSCGAEGYTVKPCEKTDTGTVITLKIKTDTEDESYSEYLDEFKIKQIVKKYSDYIRYPIKMGEDTINSMVPLWKKNKSEITEEDYNTFYKDKFFDYEAPLKVIHTSAEGMTSYNALLFVPQKAPFDFYTKEYQKGLELYSNGVLIMEKCADLLPDYFGFVKGLVDSADLSLNISREILQHDRQLKIIASNLKKKIKAELMNMLKNERDKYETFYTNFQRPLKFGIYNNYGMEKDFICDMLMFYSSTEKKLVTLDEYVARMKEDQKYIYYASGESTEKLEKLPQTEILSDKGIEILYLTEDIDEFIIKILIKHKEKDFKSVSAEDFDATEENKKETENNKDLFDFMKECLGDKVKEVRASTRLKSHPVCLASGSDISLEMEKVLNSMPAAENKVNVEKILEINTNHPVFEKLTDMFENDKDKLGKYAKVLYTNALLIEGLPIDDPIEFSNNLCDLI